MAKLKAGTEVAKKVKAHSDTVGKKTSGKSSSQQIYSTGRRKTAIARVFMTPGTGSFNVGNIDLNKYFTREVHKNVILSPLHATKTAGQFDIYCTVTGGGLSGQAGAIRLGIARCLNKHNPALRPMLREQGMLTRDPRSVERKKYGQHKARKSTQFSKR